MPVQTQMETILTIAGALLCLGGWVIFYFGSRLAGIGVGLGFGFGFGELLSAILGVTGTHQDMLVLACCVVGAFAGLVLVRAVTAMLFFVTGFLFGAFIGRALGIAAAAMRDQPFAYDPTTITIVLVSALLVGLLAVWLQAHVIIVVTSFVGANFLVAGVDYLRQMPGPALLAVFVLGVMWQVAFVTRLAPGGRKRRRDDDGDD